VSHSLLHGICYNKGIKWTNINRSENNFYLENAKVSWSNIFLTKVCWKYQIHYFRGKPSVAEDMIISLGKWVVCLHHCQTPHLGLSPMFHQHPWSSHSYKQIRSYCTREWEKVDACSKILRIINSFLSEICRSKYNEITKVFFMLHNRWCYPQVASLITTAQRNCGLTLLLLATIVTYGPPPICHWPTSSPIITHSLLVSPVHLDSYITCYPSERSSLIAVAIMCNKVLVVSQLWSLFPLLQQWALTMTSVPKVAAYYNK
jgi:hypothetical protein